MAKRRAGLIVTATEARIHFGEMIRRACLEREPIVVEKDGIPAVVILSVGEYEELEREARLARFERLSQAAGRAAEERGLTEERLEREMEEIKQQQYQRTYG
jgi:prevent-host-death family protein